MSKEQIRLDLMDKDAYDALFALIEGESDLTNLAEAKAALLSLAAKAEDILKLLDDDT